MDLLKRPVQDYVRARIGAEAIVESFEKFPRGSSRETWFLTYRERPGGAPIKRTFRADHPSGSTIPTSLEQEYFMYQRLGQTEVPVAEVLWWEDAGEWAHRSFFVRKHVEGSWELADVNNPDPAFDAYRIEISKEHLRALAKVHTLDWKRHGFDERLPAPEDEADAGAACVRMVKDQLAAFQCEAIPVLTAGLHWLTANAPPAPRLSLCKGTNGYGEEVFRDNKIVVLSDWEEAMIGDPANDFAHCQDFLPTIERDGRAVWGLPQALDFYHSISGIRVTPEAVGYYGVMRALKMVVFGHKTAAIVRDNPGAHIRQTWTATDVMNTGKQVLGSAIGLCPPVSAEKFIELNASVE